MMIRKTQYFNLPLILSLLVLAACVPKSSSFITVTIVPAMQEPATPVLTDTESPEVACFTPSDILQFTFTPDSQSIFYLTYKIKGLKTAIIVSGAAFVLFVLFTWV